MQKNTNNFFEIEKTNGFFEIEEGKVYRLRKSKKNKRLVAFTEYGKVILAENEKELHPGFAKIVSFKDKGRCFVARMENVPYDFYIEYGENETVAIPYDEFKEVLESLGFKHEYQEKINEENFFDVWANLNTGVLITMETWNCDGDKSYNSVNCYIPSYGIGFPCESMGFTSGSSSIYVFNLVFSKREFPLRECLSLNNNSMDWNGETSNLWHYGDDHDNLNYAKMLAKIWQFEDKDIGERFNMKLDETFKAYAKNGYTVE